MWAKIVGLYVAYVHKSSTCRWTFPHTRCSLQLWIQVVNGERVNVMKTQTGGLARVGQIILSTCGLKDLYGMA